MKCSWKRCCVLLVVMCFLGFAIPATGAEFQFNSQPLEDGTVEIISINEMIPNEERQYMEIPSEMDGAAVTKIGEGAFRSSYITGIGFPETIRQLGNQAFAHCHNLTEIVLPDSIETCGEYAFSGCYELETAVLSNEMTIIPKGMFEKCEKLVRVELPSAVTEIQAEAFSSCRNLSSVFIPSTVTFIDDKAFQYCNGLIATVNKGSYAESRCRELGIPLAEDVFSYQLLEDGTAEITGYSGNSVHVFVPGTIDGYPVTSVHFDSGRNERMQDIHFAEGIQRIRGIMDYSDYLETVDLPESLTEIGYNAFYACGELKSIRFPAGLKSIGNSAFMNCNKIKTIILPEGVTSVGEKTFAFMYALEEITLPASLTEIGEDAFEPDSYEKKITVYVQPGSYAEQYCSGLDYVNLQ